MSSATYLNPVYSHAAADPFVLKHCGDYWCYCTGQAADGLHFPALYSRNLVDWVLTGGTLAPIPGDHTHYWAPEVTYDNGLFYMYYSVGNETRMEIRVAVADHPGGPYVDRGRRLTCEDFAIDPHVFTDDDGTRYLFYATDFLGHGRIGTGTVMDRLLDPFTLAGQPRPVTRAHFDWQIYDAARAEKGGVCWHTVEGPFVLKHGGRYYQMFSGGNWQNASYGVAYGVADTLDTPGEWQQPCDGQHVPPVLRSDPKAGVIGPGHNSVVRGPDNVELFCVYHRWQPETGQRVLALDRLGWEEDRLVVYGPTSVPRPAPREPILAGFASAQVVAGNWVQVRDHPQLEPHNGAGEVLLPLLGDEAGGLVIEVTVHTLDAAPGTYGLRAVTATGDAVSAAIAPAEQRATVASSRHEATYTLPEPFDARKDHLLRVEVGVDGCRVWLDGLLAATGPGLPTDGGPIRELRLFTRGPGVEWAGLAAARV